MQVSQTQFFSLTRDWQWISPKQTQAWCEAFIPEAERLFFIDNDTNPQIACFGQLHKKMGITLLLITGECLRTKEIDHQLVFHFFEQIAQQKADLIYVNSDLLYSPLYEVGIRQAGFLRPVGMFSTSLSKHIYSDQPLRMSKSWHRNMKKSENNDLRFYVQDNPNEKDIQAFIKCHNELEHRKHFSDFCTEQQLTRLLQHPDYCLAWVDSPSGEHLAGVVFFCNKSYTQSLYSFTSPRGRDSGAAYLCRVGWMEYIKEKSIPVFDIGRLTPATHAKNNLFLFKNGLEGDIVTYNGEWIFTRHSLMPLAFYFANKYIFKRVRV